MNKSATAVMLLVVTIGYASCTVSRESSPALVERSDSAGVTVIDVLGAPPDTMLLDSRVIRIGSGGIGGTEDELFELISDLVLLSGGRIVVVDNRGARVAVFDSTGEWRYDVGRRGEGPGEYIAPVYASVHGDTLFVWDARQRRLSQYSADGDFLGAVALPQRRSHPFAVLEGGYVFEVESGQLMDPDPALGALTRTQRDGEILDTLVGPYPVPETGWTITDEATGMGHMINPPAFAIHPRWALGGDYLYWLNPPSGTVELRSHESGMVDGIVRFSYEIGPPTASTRDVYFQAMQAEFGFTDEVVASARRSTLFADLHPSMAAIVLGKQRLWVARHDPAARARAYVGSGWDVIDIELERTIHVRFPEGFQLLAIGNRHAYGVTTLENGVHVVDVFPLGGVPPSVPEGGRREDSRRCQNGIPGVMAPNNRIRRQMG